MILRRATFGFITTTVVTAMTALAVGGTSIPSAWADPTASPTPDDQSVVVTVPSVPYDARDDDFHAGPYRSRLHVLYNDTGTPDVTRLTLLDRDGQPVTSLRLRKVGRLTVANGYVLLDPVKEPSGRGTFSYQAASGNGELHSALARVEMVPEVIRVRNDRGNTRRSIPVVLDVAANDRLVVAGSTRVCGPLLSAARPTPADPLPVVLPEPDSLPFPCPDLTIGVPDAGAVLVTAAGRWAVDELGRVSFVPAMDFHGTATAFYRQAVDAPFDLGVGRLRVRVFDPGETDVLGVKEGPKDDGSGPGVATPGEGGSGGGVLPHTGAEIAVTLLIGAGLLGAGATLVRAGRRRRQARARNAYVFVASTTSDT